MYARAMKDKTAATAAKTMEKILEDFKKEFPGTQIKTMLMDDGSEFKNAKYKTQKGFIQVLKENKIERRLILGGNPQQNGMVERANGKLKMILAKNKAILGGTWTSHLKRATDIYNKQLNRGIGQMPSVAVKFTSKEDIGKVIAENRKQYKVSEEAKKKVALLDVGTVVRIKLNKGVLSKSSAPSWSDKLYSISKVIGPRGTMATKYNIAGIKDLYKFTRNDVQIVDRQPNKIPKSIRKAKAKLSAEEARHMLRNGKRTLVDGGFTRISESDEESEEEEDERKEAPKPKAKKKIKKTAAEIEAEALKSMQKDWLKKRVKMPNDQEDGDPGTVVKIERRKVRKTRTKKRKIEEYFERQWWFKIDWDDSVPDDGIDPWVNLKDLKVLRAAFLG
jgi:hypothetical protein